MSFNFGAGTGGTGGGFNFGASAASTPATSTPQQSTGGFGAGTTAGFSFGAVPQATATASPAVGAFSFDTPTATNPAGGIRPGTTPTATPSGGITMGTTLGATLGATQKPAAAPFSFGPPATSATTGYNFGTTAPAAVSSAAAGFGFSAAPASGAAAATGMAGFGKATPAAQTATQPTMGQTTGFSFGNTTSSTTGLGGFGVAATTKPVQAAAAVVQPQATAVHVAPSSTLQGSTLSGLLSGAQSKPQGVAQPLMGGPKFGDGIAAPTAGQTTQGLTLGATASTAGPSVGFAAPSVASTGLKLGVPATTSAATTGGFGLTLGATAATSASGFGLGKPVQATTTTIPATLSTTTTTTQSAASIPQMNYTQLEESINKWTLDLEEQEKVFLEQATQVNAWDRLLIDNGEKITQLNTDVERVKIDQTRLDQELDFINAQQRELEDMLVPLEQAMEQLPPINYQQHADLEREHTYKLSENIDGQLKHMSQDLKEIIEHINANNTNQDRNDPVTQIAKILNAHMDSLQWVDQNTALLQRRVDEVAKTADLRRKEQERNFRLAYD